MFGTSALFDFASKDKNENEFQFLFNLNFYFFPPFTCKLGNKLDYVACKLAIKSKQQWMMLVTVV